MDIDLLRTVSVSAFGIGIVLLLIAVILFVRWKVPFLIAEISGANSRKEIARIQRVSEQGRHTSGIHMTAQMGTQTASALETEETTVLSDSSVKETGKTSLLHDGGSETTVLSDSVVENSTKNNGKQQFRIEYEIGFSAGKSIIE